MQVRKLSLAIAAVVFSGAAAAEFSANIGATSNYVWRGVTQTGDQAAVSGGLDYAHESGFYAGTWASNVDFDDGATAEVDLYGGFASEIAGFGYDIGVIRYIYPGEGYDFTELAGSVSYGPFSAGVNYIVDSETNDENDSNDLFIDGDIYYFVAASVEVAPTWTVGATAGYYDFDDDGAYDAAAMEDIDTSYWHYQLDVGKSAGEFGDFVLSVSKAQEESGDSAAKVFVSWGKTFD